MNTTNTKKVAKADKFVNIKGERALSPYPCPACLKKGDLVRMSYHYASMQHQGSYCHTSLEYECTKCKALWHQETPQMTEWKPKLRDKNRSILGAAL